MPAASPGITTNYGGYTPMPLPSTGAFPRRLQQPPQQPGGMAMPEPVTPTAPAAKTRYRQGVDPYGGYQEQVTRAPKYQYQRGGQPYGAYTWEETVGPRSYYDYQSPTQQGGAGGGGGGGMDMGTPVAPDVPQQPAIDLRQLTQLAGQYGGGGTVQAPPSVAPLTAVQSPTEEAATFGRAKERIGQTLQGALKSLSSAMSRRGVSGAGFEGTALANLIGQAGVGQLGEVSRDQAVAALNRAVAAQQATYQGDLTQRGQDIGVAQVNAAQRDRMLMTLLDLASKGYRVY